ncbi:TPA: ABC transporter permease [Candidatus Poribacteria bacterium]|nr:ABC transporter permease [Candidatus Poribacteria bacterium]
MTTWTLVKRGLRFYWRTHLGVMMGAAVAAAILVGALVVGDSVRHSLKILALSRLGEVQLALAPQNRYFRAELADDLAAALNAATAPVLVLPGIAANSDGTARANRVQTLGVDERFWDLSAGKATLDGSLSDEESLQPPLIQEEVFLSERLAMQLDVRAGEEILLRVEKPNLLSRDAPLSTDADSSVAMRLLVKMIVSDLNFGRFSLQANQVAPFNAFVSLQWLQKRAGIPDRANMLLIGDSSKGKLTPAIADEMLRRYWQLADADLELRELPEQGVVELRTGTVFLDPPAALAAERAMPDAFGILTYFVNELRCGDRATPYSMVAAIDKCMDDNGKSANLIPPDMGDGEILINAWLAEDLQAKPGDTLELRYFVFGPMRKLEEQTSSFRIRSVLPTEGAAADRELTPMFPGLSDAENCRDWQPGIPIDLDKIREKDEEYWDLYRGTPKAFVTLTAGQRMWGNRFGNLTAIRYPLANYELFQRRERVGENESWKTSRLKDIEESIKRELNPASIGLFFRPVREQALKASAQGIDFGQLFLGLSFFLIVAALLLTGLLFVFGVEQRAEEVGTLLALGFPPSRVRRLLLLEGGALAIIGGLLGTGAGVWYTKTVLYALSTVWRNAIGGGAPLHYYANPSTLIVGAVAGVVSALLAIWSTLRRQGKSPARELLNSGADTASSLSMPKLAESRFGLWVALGAVVGTVVVLLLVDEDKGAMTAFFISGALLLIGGIGFSQALLAALARATAKIRLKLSNLGLRNSARRIGRSLATIGLLACGSFLIIAIGANRHNPNQDVERRSSGTGGFALFAESTLPVLRDLNSDEGREAYSIDSEDLEGVAVVPIRVHDGDDASCLNLNRAQTPRLLGIRPEELQARNAFTFVKTIPIEAGHPIEYERSASAGENPWLLLNRKENDNTVTAISDEATITWALGKKVGDTLPYIDERGNTFNIQIVGTVANSIFQGGLLISEDEFVTRFPSESGYRMFLIDAPWENVEVVSKTLSRALQDVGMEITPTAQRLAEFNAVQNTYLSIFQLLGGLALLLGSAGLGIVVLRNVMERRSELALLRAVGFERRSIRWLVLSEHCLLLLLGLASGAVAGLVAVLPALRSPGADVPYVSLTMTLLAVFSSGALWTWIATMFATRGPLLAALRNE